MEAHDILGRFEAQPERVAAGVPAAGLARHVQVRGGDDLLAGQRLIGPGL
jgi:hypothetical protein